MYLKNEFAEPDLAALHAFIRTHPLGIFTTGLPSANHPFLQSTHIPFILDDNDSADENKNEASSGILRAHIARQNPQTKTMIECLQQQKQQEESSENMNGQTGGDDDDGELLNSQVLILFNSPTAHYVTPKYYTSTKPATGKVAPTWNYAAVQVYGRARIYHDSSSGATDGFLSEQLKDLSRFTEEEVMGFTGGEAREEPWRLDEAPERYIAMLKKNIVGIRIEIERIEGKFKMSQERPVGDRDGVVAGFSGLGTQVGDDMAEMVKERGALRDQALSR